MENIAEKVNKQYCRIIKTEKSKKLVLFFHSYFNSSFQLLHCPVSKTV